MAARVMKPTAKEKVPVKAPGRVVVSKKEVVKGIGSSNVKQKPAQSQSTIVKLKKSPEPKNVRILITNNTQKITAPVAQAEVKTKVSKTKKASKHAVSVPSTTVLEKPAIRSPFRFPILTVSRLPMVARVMGFVFILVGAFFSLLSAPSTGDTILSLVGSSHSAEIISPLPTNIPNDTAGSDEMTNSTPNIFVEGNSPLKGNVPIVITVPNAKNVKVILYNKNSKQLSVLDVGVKVDPNTWRFYWRTEQYSDAEYQIKVVIQNKFKTYDYTGPETYNVTNKPPKVPVTDDEDDTPEISKEDIPIKNGNPVAQLFTTNSDILTNKVNFWAHVDGATRVTVHALNINAGALYYVGLAKKSNDTKWVLDWESELIPDGEYDFFIRATVDGEVIESSRNNYFVANYPVELPIPATTTEIINPIAPSIELSLIESSPVSGFAHLSITTSPVEWVELYSKSVNSLTTHFLGLATKRSDTEWAFEWDTSQTPNGVYLLNSRVKTPYGFTEGVYVDVVVRNQAIDAFTVEQEDVIDGLKDIALNLPSVSNLLPDTIDGSAIYVEPVDSFVSSIDTDDDSRTQINTLLSVYRKRLDILLGDLAHAQRKDDVDAMKKAKDDIENLKNNLIEELPEGFQKKKLVNQINTYLSETTSKLQELTLRNENILKERVGDSINSDSDRDGIVDYDEVNLYKTNPFAADTDNDGFIDSAEITLGYNPHNSAPEALVTYQSPKETGIVREDLLTIDTITTLSSDSSDGKPRAFISGSALPNSFVTLYVYSTPIMVTVKTRSDGSWNYIFDKELENGDHEVYVVIVDNAGGVLAKSEPLAFVKTAEAFTRADALSAALEAQNTQPSFANRSDILFVASVIIVSLGLVLLLIGALTRNKKSILEVAHAS